MRIFSVLLLLTFALTVFATNAVQAKRIQIIHTNDLHSYFNPSYIGGGGYAKVKTIIDKLKADALAKGIHSIVMDAGDWGDGTSFFLADDGSSSFKALGLLGIDVTLVGNHDHMMGVRVLAEQIKKANIHTKAISANLIQMEDTDLRELVKGTLDVEVDGVKLNIIGLSTPEPTHQAPLFPSFVAPPELVVFGLAQQAKKDGADLVIALTHLGLSYDKRIAKSSRAIDIIVGGHSHTRMEKIEYKKNKNGKNIPIVQTGAHGMAVGSLILDVKSKTEYDIVSYDLHDVTEETPRDPTVAAFVELAKQQRNEAIDNRFNEVVGFSNIELTGHDGGKAYNGPSCWGDHLAKMTQEAGGTDVGIHLAVFTGSMVPAGEITFGNLVDNYPHVREYGDPGWEISTFKLKGKAFKTVLLAILSLRDTFNIHASGATYKSVTIPASIPWLGGKVIPYSVRINGKKIDKNKEYTMSIPGEIEFALKKMLRRKARKVLPGLTGSKKYYWPEMEKYLRANSPLSCLNEV